MVVGRVVQVAALLVACAIGPVRAAAAPSPSTLSALRGLQAREARIERLSGTIVEHYYLPVWTYPPTGADGQPAKPPRPATHAITALRFAARHGQSRLDAVQLRPGHTELMAVGPPDRAGQPYPAGLQGDQVLSVADGQRLTTYWQRSGFAMVVDQSKRQSVSQTAAIGGALLLNRGAGTFSEELAEALDKTGLLPADGPPTNHLFPVISFAELPAEQVDGRPCVGLAYTMRAPGDEPVTVRCWLCAELGYAVIRCSLETAAPTPIGLVRVVVTTDATAFQPVAAGLWLPTRTVRNERRAMPDGRASSTLRICHISELSMEPVPDSRFTVELPIGTMVQDSARGAGYRVGGLGPGAEEHILLRDETLCAAADRETRSEVAPESQPTASTPTAH